MKNTFSKIKSIGAIAALALVIASCSKESVTNTSGITVKPANATAEQKRAAMELARRAPSTVRVYDENDQRFIDVDFKAQKLAFKPATERDFNFATPNNGWNYSNSSDVVRIADKYYEWLESKKPQQAEIKHYLNGVEVPEPYWDQLNKI